MATLTVRHPHKTTRARNCRTDSVLHNYLQPRYFDWLIVGTPSVKLCRMQRQLGNNTMKNKVLGLIGAVVLSLTTTASADTITYTVGSWGPATYQLSPGNLTYPGDTLAMTGLTDQTLTLVPGTPVTAKLNDLIWTVGYQGISGMPSEGLFPFTVSRQITMVGGSPDQQVIQNGTLVIAFDYDQLTLNMAAGGPLTFDFGSYTVEVTALGLDPINRGNLGPTTHEVKATFVLHQVPDGGLTAMLLGMGMLGLGWVRRMVK